MPAPMVRTSEPGIYKRGSKYVIVYYVNGKQKRESCPTLAAAKRLKRKRQVAVDDGSYQEPARIQLGTFAREWIESYHGKPGKEFRESTRDGYRRDIEAAIEFFGAKKQIGRITAHDMADFVTWLNDPKAQGKQYAPSTLRNKVAPLAACLGTAFERKLIPSNPATGINYPGKKVTATLESGDLEGEADEDNRALTAEQLGWLLTIVNPRYRLLIEFLALTGVRISEARALQWRHLDLTGRDGSPQVRIRRQFYKGRIGEPKSKYGRRSIPLAIDLADKLQRLRDESPFADELDLVFATRTGKPFSPSNIASRHLKPAATEAGAAWASFHTLRHTCASMLFAEGRNLKQVQAWLGHHSADFTLRTYIHLMDDGKGGGLALPTVTMKVTTGHTETGGNPLREIERETAESSGKVGIYG